MLEFFEKKLKQVDNRARFLSSVLSGDIKIVCENQKELLQEIAEKGFDPLPKEELPVATWETGDKEEDGGSDGVYLRDYEYLTSMTISTLNEGYLEHLLELKKRFETKVGLLRKATPKCQKSEMEPTLTISPDVQLLDANYIKAQSDGMVVIVIASKDNNVFEAVPRRQHKRTAAEYEAMAVLMDDDENHLAGSLKAQEQSETESAQKQHTKKQREQRKKQRMEESRTSAMPCHGLDSQCHDRSNRGYRTEEIKKIASGLDGVKITHCNRDQNRVDHELAKLSLHDASLSL